MKTTAGFLSLLFAVILMPIHAQVPPGPAANGQQEGSSMPHPRVHGPMKGLSDEERDKLKAAHDAALQRDPLLRQNLENARMALREAMIRIDPSVAPILEKMSQGKPEGNRSRGGNPEGRPPKGEGQAKPPGEEAIPGMAKLTEGEREQLRKIRDQVKGESDLVKARGVMKSSSTPQERRQAEESYQVLVKAAMLKADPSIGPVLEKLGKGKIPTKGAGPSPVVP